MGHQGDTISMGTHLKALAKERKKREQMIAGIERMVGHWRTQASEIKRDGCVEQRAILVCVAGLMGLLLEKTGTQVGKFRSPCHKAPIDFSRVDGVNIGTCSVCGKQLVRQNPRTRIVEWLDNYSPWYQGDLRPVVLGQLISR